MNTNFDMYTEFGADNVQKARDNWDKAHGFEVESESSFLEDYWWVIAIIIIGWWLLK